MRELDLQNAAYDCDIKQWQTTVLFDDFCQDESKKYLIIKKAVSFADTSFYAKLDLIIAKTYEGRIIIYDNDPPLTASYLKTKSPFYYRMGDISTVATRRECLLIGAIHDMRTQIRRGAVNDIIWFKKPVVLHAQSSWDRKKGTFDGGNCNVESVKLYGETSYSCYICGVRIRSIFW